MSNKIRPGEIPSMATIYNDALSWKVRSRRKAKDDYVVELGAYNCNGQCFCKDFRVHFEPLLTRGYTPERALKEELVEIRWYQVFAENALRCWHIMDARHQFTTHAIKSLQAAAQKNTAGARH